ncbi:MAG: DUF1549 and DUF1553 domain-containing protein [Pirellulales bacterium]
MGFPPPPYDGSRAPQVALIDRHMHQAWRQSDLEPSPAASDRKWCRRVHLDVIGRIPTVAELNAFLDDRSADKKARLVAKLLGETDERYAGEYASHWATVWTNILIGRTGGTGDDSLTSRAGMHTYLREQFRRNAPYDRLVRELITATGATRPQDEGFNGATNFLVTKLADDAVQATAKTAQIFLGLQVQCTQCHNHPFNDWKQNQFWELNAFFRQARALRRFEGGNRAVSAELIDQDFAGESNEPAEADVFFEMRNGLVKVAYPAFVDGTSLVDLHGAELGNSGYVSDVNRRQELGKLLIESRWLDKAIVNRMWAHFLGYGFTKPPDDMGPHNPPSHPELLDALGSEFRASGFDLKQLIRWIALSEPYALASRTTRHNESDDPTIGARPQFSRFYLRPMQAEQLYESLLVATRADRVDSETSEAQIETRRRWLSQFTRAFGTDDGGETTTFNGTIPQTLMMMNGELVRKATELEPGNLLYDVLSNSKMSDREQIEHLYLAALSRPPTRDEIGQANKLVALRGGNRAEALADVFWALLNSNEFILIH